MALYTLDEGASSLAAQYRRFVQCPTLRSVPGTYCAGRGDLLGYGYQEGCDA
jgi:hypothetical protein